MFELQAVLKQGQAEERQRQLEVAALEAQRREIEDLIRSYQRDLMHERAELREQLDIEKDGAVKLDLRGVRFQAGAALRLVTLAQRAVLQLAGVHKKLDAARITLLEAAMKRKAVETLRERRLEEWKYQQKKLEEASTDEMNVVRAARAEEAL